MNNIYLHAIYPNNGGYDIRNTHKILLKILKSGAILSRRLQKKELSISEGFNGIDYISVCDYEKRNCTNQDINYKNYNAYHNYVTKSLSLMFLKDDVEAITPIIVDAVYKHKYGYYSMSNLGMSDSERYSR